MEPQVRLAFVTVVGLLLMLPASSLSGCTVGDVKKPPVTDVVFAPDATRLLSISQSGLTIHSWPERKLQRTIELSMVNPHCIAFSPKGKQIAIGGGTPSEDGTIEVFSWPELKPITKLEGHTDSVMSIAWQSDRTIASASLDKEVRLWDIESGEAVRMFEGHSRGVTTVRFLADKQTMLTAGIDQSIRVWNSETGELIRSMSMHTKPIHDVAVRPATDGLPMVASASDDRTVRLWQPTIGRMVRFAKLPVRPLNVEWLPDGSRVIAVCTDGKAYTIDPDTVEITQVTRAMRGWVWAMAVHEDGVAVGGPNGSVRRIRSDAVSPTPMTKFTPNFFAFQNGLGFGSASEEAKFLKELGFTGVCQVYDRGEKLAQRVAAYDATNVRVGSVYLNVNDEPITADIVKPLAHRSAMIELTIQRMSSKTVDAVRQTAEMADRLGLQVALYPHHGFSIATMPQAIELAEKVDHPNLGIMFNLCHFLKNEKPETLAAVLEQVKPYLFAISTSGADADGTGWNRLIQPLNRGTFRQAELFKLLKDLNYRGPVGLQCFGVNGDKRENLKTSMVAWRKILDTVNSEEFSKAKTDE